MLHFDAAEALVELQNGALWHKNREEGLKRCKKPPNFDSDDKNIEEHLLLSTILDAEDPNFVQKVTNSGSQALHPIWDLVKADVENEIFASSGESTYQQKSISFGCL